MTKSVEIKNKDNKKTGCSPMVKDYTIMDAITTDIN